MPNRAISGEPMETDDILILREPVTPKALKLRVQLHGDMVKFVVDVERGVVALGGELHSDAEATLIEDGSRPAHLWGANYHPGLGPEECIRFTSLINIRPRQGNLSMEVEDATLRARIADIVHRLVGRGEALA